MIENIGTDIGKFLGHGKLRSTLRSAFHGLLLLGSGGRGIRRCLPGGEVVRLVPRYRHAAWNPLEYEAFKACIRPGDVALDIGANVGAYALLLGQWVGSSGKVFAFEPAPETFGALGMHVRINNLKHVLTPIPKAIADHSGELDFLAAGFEGTNRLVSQPSDPSALQQRVQAVSIDDFCAKHHLRPNFIKIDIEGFELAALRGARETIRARGDKLALFVEMHPTIWRTLGITREEVLAELDAQNLLAQPLTHDTDPWLVEGVCMRLVPRG